LIWTVRYPQYLGWCEEFLQEMNRTQLPFDKKDVYKENDIWIPSAVGEATSATPKANPTTKKLPFRESARFSEVNLEDSSEDKFTETAVNKDRLVVPPSSQPAAQLASEIPTPFSPDEEQNEDDDDDDDDLESSKSSIDKTEAGINHNTTDSNKVQAGEQKKSSMKKKKKSNTYPKPAAATRPPESADVLIQFTLMLFVTRANPTQEELSLMTFGEQNEVNLPFQTGRPNYSAIFQVLRRRHAHEGRMRLLVCGPPAMTESALEACDKHCDEDFNFDFEDHTFFL